MNNAFKEKHPLILGEGFRVENDGFNGVVLIERVTKIYESGKNKGESYESEDKHYYPRVDQALSKYLNIVQRKDLTISAIIDNTQKAVNAIEEIRKHFKHFD